MTPSVAGTATATVRPALSVRDLVVGIGGSVILHGVGFDVASGGVTALLGRNGVGKTTTLRAILGLLPPGSSVTGDVRFDGRPVLGTPTHRLIRAGIGYVPEDRGVFSALTVAENLRLAERAGVRPDYERVRALFPELASRSGQRAGTLSGGQQQMVALGRVLLAPARLLLIDEPTKGLAPKVVGEVCDAIERLATDQPILLVEQNVALVRRLAADAVVLVDGQVAYTGPATDLLSDPDRTRSLLGVGGRTHR